MNPENRSKLRTRVVAAAEAALAKQGYVSAIDVLSGIGWLDQATLTRWKQAQLPYLEAGIQTNLSRAHHSCVLRHTDALNRLAQGWPTWTSLNNSKPAELHE